MNSSSKYNLTSLERKAIEEAIEECKKGNVFSHEDVMAEAKQKYSNLKFE